MTGVVERAEEGIVIIDWCDGTRQQLPAADMLLNSGDVVAWRNGTLIRDEAKTLARRRRITEKKNLLFAKEEEV